MADRPILFLKALVRGYTRKDGTHVAAYHDRRPSAAARDAHTPDLFAKPAAAPAPVRPAVPICRHCGEPEHAELFEVWGDREFQIETCCEDKHDEVIEELQDPDTGAEALRRMDVDGLTGRSLRRVVDDGVHLVLDWKLDVRPLPQAEAKAFILVHHAHNPPPAGDKFRAGVWNGPDLVGVVMVGRPVARAIDHATTVEVNRLCVDRNIPDALRWKACSTLYRWAAKEAEARGYKRIITYTLESETGMSLRYARWKREAETRGGSWNRPGRARTDKAPTEPKVRWAVNLHPATPQLVLKSHVQGYTRRDGAHVQAHERIVRHLTREQAHQALGDAWWGGKNSGQPRRDHDYTGNDDGSGYVLAHVPLDRVRPNEAGDRYDGTADPERVVHYAQAKIDTPVHLLHNERAARRGDRHANVMDGGHRVSAARLRGDADIPAIMQRSHFERLMAHDAPLAKAASIPDGARWITVHPNGPGTDGQPVLIQPNPDGSAHVIGGAGGKLNYLKLRGVKKESDYKADLESKRKAKAEQRKIQAKQDKEAGIAEKKKQVKDDIRRQQREHEAKFVQTVAQTMGWDPKELALPEEKLEGLSEAAQAKAAADHHRAVMRRASEAVEMQRQRLVADHGARAEAGIGEIPVESKDPAVISVQDLNPTPVSTGAAGFSHDFKKRAEEAGLTDDEVKKEAAPIKEERAAQLTDAQRQAAVQRGETAKLVKEELKNIREPIAPKLDPTLVDAKKAAELLRAAKALKQIQKKAREANAAVDKSAVEPKAYVIEYTADPEQDAKIAEDLNSDLRTAQTRAFLSEFQRLGGERPEETLGKHIAVGAYNSVNSLALAVGGQALIDRSVVDVLGIAGAAQVLARRIHTDLPGDVDRITEGVQEFHLHHYMETSAEALGRARELTDAAKEIELGETESGSDLQVAQEMNARRRRAVVEAQKILGQSLGEMEANAALTVALKRGKTDQFQVSLGKKSIESAITQVRAIGLQRGDYTLEDAGGNVLLTVKGEGLDRLAKPIDRADVEQVKRNLAIINGDQDEDGWLPLGIARRPDLNMDVKPGVAPRLAEPFQPGEDLEQALLDYIGGRAADGDAPGDIVADIQSAAFFDKVGADRAEAYRQALDAVAPLNDGKGRPRRAEALAGDFDGYADVFVQNRHGGKVSPVNRQQFEVGDTSVEALHRALSDTPEGVAAFKQIGELTPQDQRALREFFHKNIAKESPEAGDLRRQLEEHTGAEPARTAQDMFGEETENPEWADWSSRRGELAGKVNASSLDWAKYADTMHGHEKAYEAVQDLIRSRVSKGFVEAHNRLNPGKPLKLGKSVIRNNLNHLDATDHAARDERLARERELVDSLRERSAGRYAAGSVSDKLDAAREKNEALEQSQMGFFSTEETPTPTPDDQVLAGDERHTLGHAAERQLAGMMGVVGQNFKPGQPLKLWTPTMSGGKNAARQRLVKLVDANKRVVAAFGTGSGKTLLGLASYTHLHEQGKAGRGLFLVPSVVQGQFAGEALRYLQPGKYKWNIEPGASREQRIAAHKDAGNHFTVMTHQSFRDDMLHLGAKHAGIGEDEMSSRLAAMSDDERKDWMRGTLEREGIKYDYLNVDEGQNVLNRAGKENSGMANVVDALSHPDVTPYYVSASGDPVKNDASEVFDLMRKMDPARYSDRGAFMRRYGADTLASKDALRREMARHVFPSKIDPDVAADKKESKIELSAGQRQALAELDGHFTRARIARMQGKVDLQAMRAISPQSFEGLPEDQHEARAKELQQSLGIMKSSAVQRVISTHPDNAVAEDVVTKAAERKGKPGVVFAHSLGAVKMLAERLEKAGHRVVTITGADSAKEKERKRRMFNPEQGDAQADILVASDAGSTGMNIQRGQWLYQADTPQTAMTHAQRLGRIFRTGQQNDVELIDAVPNHPEVHRARERLSKKYGLRDVMTSSLEGLDESGIAQFLRERQVRSEGSQDALL